MRSLKKLAVIAAAVFALSAAAAASATAAQFTAEESGPIHGDALTNQVFVTDGGGLICETATTTGNVTALAATSQEVTVHYEDCIWLGFVGIEISPATYEFTAEGMDNDVHILSPITINIPLAGCHVTIPAQTVGTVTFENDGGNLIERSSVSGIHYIGSGGLCGGAGVEKTNGTFEGAGTIEGELEELGLSYDE
jgi:hypothetical protein